MEATRHLVAVPVLRTLGPADAPRLAALSSALGAETAADWALRLRRDGAVVVGAEVGNDLVGYAAGEVRRSFGLDGAVGWIDAFGVDLAYRGHGLGRTLAAGLLGALRELGATHVYTVVPVHDRAMSPFFRELGFRDEPLACLGRDL